MLLARLLLTLFLAVECSTAHVFNPLGGPSALSLRSPHQIQARATHPSGFNASAYSSFTNNYQNEVASDQIDAAGFLRTRTRTGNGQTNGVQTLFWDGRGRLWKVTERDANQNGYDLVAVYDGLDRRLRTTETPVTNSTLLSTQAKVVDQYFDPQFEFLELGAAQNGFVTWKIPGPDLNGRYGGLSGIGGFEAYCPGPEFFCPIISDSQGNLHGVYDQQHLMITWYPSRLGAYGPVPAAAPPPFGDGGSLDQARASHNRGIDRTGFSWRGARYFDSVTFSFLSPDPLGFVGGSHNLRTSFRGRPTDITDADGRLGVASWTGIGEGLKEFGVTGFHGANLMSPGGALNERLWGPLVNAASARFEDLRDSLVSDFSPLQGKFYVGGSFIGEVGPNFIPVAGGEEALASVLGRFEGWATKNAPVLLRDVGDLAEGALSWLDSAVPRLNPANYRWGSGRVYTGVPLPEYSGPKGGLHP